MIVIPPIDCTASGVLTASNAVDYQAYNAATAYAAYVVATGYTTTTACSYGGRNWTSVQAANTGHTPGTDAAWWLDDGPSNQMAMFDTAVKTATTHTGHLIVTLHPGRFSAIGLMGLVGNSIQIDIVDGAFSQTYTQTLANSDGTFFGWCFEDFLQKHEAAFNAMPGVPSASVTITIYGDSPTTGATACGLCVIGKAYDIGQAEYGFQVGVEDRGRHYLDSLGNPVNLERGYAKGISGTIVNRRGEFNRHISWLADHIGTPCLWVASPSQTDLVAATVFGRYVRAVPVIANFDKITTSIEIAGYQ